jgi:class 3 adenylate cyclase
MSATSIDALLFDEAWRSERFINVFRALVWTAITTAILAADASGAFNPAIAVGLLYGVACGVLSVTWLRKRYHRAFPYVATIMDFGLLMAIHEQTHAFLLATNSAEAMQQLHGVVPALMVLMAVNMLRFSWRVTALATVAAVFGYLHLSLSYESTNRVTVMVNVGQMVGFGGLLAFSSVLLRRIIHRVKERDAFARFLPGPVVERLTRDPTAIQLGGERQDATVLFTDIRGFSQIADEVEPEVVVALLNEYFQEMVEEVFDHHGILDKFIGDGLCAVFNELGGDDHAHRAVACAQGMIARLATINAARVGRGEEAIAIGIGIHTGKLVAGNIGSQRRLEYTHIGETVNTAARIEGMTKDLAVPLLISDTTHGCLESSDLRFVSRGEQPVRGRSKPITVYALA